MKKRMRVVILSVVAAAVVIVAGLAWLGYVPAGKPDNELDFMAQQLRRVRYAGPLRGEDEKALADLLPPDPTIDDLRVAYCKRLSAMMQAVRQDAVKSRPELLQYRYPDFDQAARQALDALNQRAAQIEKTSPLDDWLHEGKTGWDLNRCTAFLDGSADMPPRLAPAVPASGKVLLKFVAGGDPDMPQNVGAAVRVMAVRVRCLYATGDAGHGWQELSQLASFCRDADYGPLLIGQLCYEFKNSLMLLKCALPLARDGKLSADQLEDLVARHQLKVPNPLDVAQAEEAFSLVATADVESSNQPLLAKAWTEAAFERHGATSLGHWLESEIEDSRLRHQGWSARLDGLAKRGGSSRDPRQVAALLDTSDRDKGDWVLDQAKILATAAATTAESEGLLLALKLFALKARDPAGWRDQTASLAAEYPLARLEKAGTAIEVRPNLAHPAMAYLKESDRVYATVP